MNNSFDIDDYSLEELLEEAQKRFLEMEYDWDEIARPEQKMPKEDWHVWLILAGRGFGKTRTGAQTIHQLAMSGKYPRIALVGETEHDVRSVMVEGQSGILNIASPLTRPQYNSSCAKLVWPNGAIAQLFSAQTPDALRGPEFYAAWVDELAKYPHPQNLYDQLNFTLRLGQNPKMIITTTPRPISLIKDLLSKAYVHITRGSTFDNARNLSAHFIKHIKDLYQDTDLGAQELEGEIVHVSGLFREGWFKHGYP